MNLYDLEGSEISAICLYLDSLRGSRRCNSTVASALEDRHMAIFVELVSSHV